MQGEARHASSLTVPSPAAESRRVALARAAHGGKAVEDAAVERDEIASLPVGAGVGS
jgi:hypothetical protein